MPGIRQKKRAKTQSAILRAASALISKKGFAQTSIEDIAHRAQVGVGTVYNYFGSKTALLLALLERDTQGLLREGEAALAQPDPKPESGLTRLFSIYMRGYLTVYERKMLGELFALAFYQPKELGRQMMGLDVQLMHQVGRLLQEYKHRGILKKSLPLEEATHVLYASFAFLVMMYLESEEMSLESAQNQMGKSIHLILDDWQDGKRHASGTAIGAKRGNGERA